LSTRFTSWLQLRQGEGRLAALTAAMMLIPGAGIAIGVSSAESLLLSRVGADALPRLYIVLGVVTIGTTLAITTVMGRIPALRFYLMLPIVIAAFLLASRFLVLLDQNWIYEGLWVASSLFHTLLQVMLWGVASMAFDTRQAKRLYPLFAAADIAGFSAGGLITPVLVSWLGTANLLIGWAATLLAGFFLARALVPAAPANEADKGPRTRRARRSALKDLLAGFEYVRSSRLLFWMAVSGLLFQALVYLLWFVFSSAAENYFLAEDELTGFLGAFRGATTGTALLASLLIATRFNLRFGLVASFVLLAVFDVIGFSALIVAGGFFAVVGLRFIHEVWQSGVARNAWQAMFNVVPVGRREQTRLFINGVCLQVGAMLIGGILIAAKGVGATIGAYLVGVVLSVVALLAAWRVRGAYLSALVDALRAGRPLVFHSEEDPFGAFQRDPSESAVAIAGLTNPDAAVRRAASAILVDLGPEQMVPSLVEHLQDPDATVRANLLRALARSRAGGMHDEVIPCLQDPDPEVREQAVAALRRMVSDPQVLARHVAPLLADPESAVRAMSAATLLRQGSMPDAQAVLEALAGADGADDRVQGLRGFADWGDASALARVAAGLEDHHVAVRRAAAAAMAQLEDPQCLGMLVRALGDNDHSVRDAVASAIAGFGSDAVAAVVEALENPDLEDGAILALNRLPVAPGADAVRDAARTRINAALSYHDRWLPIRRWADDNESAGLLADTLKQVAERHGINVLRLLGTLADREAFDAAISSLGSPDRGEWANAIEILDSVSERQMVRPLLQVWEAGTQDAGTDYTAELLESLRDDSPWVRACATMAARGVTAGEVTAELAVLARDDPDDTVRATAANALTGDQPMESLDTLSIMERILFLKRVPLFSDLAPPELKQVASITDEHVFQDGELLAEQGEAGEELFIIVSGEVLVLYDDGDKTTELARRKTGDYVGEMAIISKAPRVARLAAVGEVRTLVIGQKQFEVILRERPETSMAVMRVLCERLRERGNASG